MQFNQSSSVQPVSEIQKSEKISKNHFFPFFYFIFFKKKCYSLSFPILGGRDLTRTLQSTPFQNPGGVVWAWQTKSGGQRTEILVSNFGYYKKRKILVRNKNIKYLGWYCGQYVSFMRQGPSLLLTILGKDCPLFIYSYVCL